MNEFLQDFVESEVNSVTYGDLWNFVNSESICRGTFEGINFVIMKISAGQFIIYKVCVGMENTKCQPAIMVAKKYFLMKINSRAYELQLNDIQKILD